MVREGDITEISQLAIDQLDNSPDELISSQSRSSYTDNNVTTGSHDEGNNNNDANKGEYQYDTHYVNEPKYSSNESVADDVSDYDDGSVSKSDLNSSTVDDTNLNTVVLSVGERVEEFLPLDNAYYSGTINEGTKYGQDFVVNDDDDVERLTFC